MKTNNKKPEDMYNELFTEADNPHRAKSGIWWLCEQDEDWLWKLFEKIANKDFTRVGDKLMASHLTFFSEVLNCRKITANIWEKFRTTRPDGKWVAFESKKKDKMPKPDSITDVVIHESGVMIYPTINYVYPKCPKCDHSLTLEIKQLL
ncbi:MAG TPA: hypothetical protein ENH82_06730 [bacterium]|nr:hypothetical protein [bacterium]